MREPTVGSVMTTTVITVRPQTPFKAVVSAMTDNAISAVPVIGPRGRPIGVVSEADTLAKQEFHGGADDLPSGSRANRGRWYRSQALNAAEMTTSPVLTVGADEPVTVAARQLTDKQVRRLFVVDQDGELVGVVSRRDVLRLFLRADEEIRACVVEALTRDLGLAPGVVTVQVHDGVATVDGVVDRRSATREACRLVRTVPGVVGCTATCGTAPTTWLAPRPGPGVRSDAAREETAMYQATVESVTTAPVITAGLRTPFKEVVSTLAGDRISAVAVVDERGRPVGVVSEADTVARQE